MYSTRRTFDHSRPSARQRKSQISSALGSRALHGGARCPARCSPYCKPSPPQPPIGPRAVSHPRGVLPKSNRLSAHVRRCVQALAAVWSSRWNVSLKGSGEGSGDGSGDFARRIPPCGSHPADTTLRILHCGSHPADPTLWILSCGSYPAGRILRINRSRAE